MSVRPPAAGLKMLSILRHQIMIRNGLYLAETRFLDGVEAYNRHVMVLRDGTMRGGGGFYYTVGSYTCADGKWKGVLSPGLWRHQGPNTRTASVSNAVREKPRFVRRSSSGQ